MNLVIKIDLDHFLFLFSIIQWIEIRELRFKKRENITNTIRVTISECVHTF